MFRLRSGISFRARFAAFGAFILLSTPAMSEELEKRYLVLLNDAGGPGARFSSQITRAGGHINLVVEEIGLVFATSGDPAFKSRVERIRGVQNVAYSLPIQMDQDIQFALGPQNDHTHPGQNEFLYPLLWGLDVVGAPEAWNAGHTGEGVRVAVLDGGIDHDNPDLVGNLNAALSASFMPCVFGANCDGYYEDWRVREVGEYPEFGEGPFFNHGTHVAGTIAAAGNGYGVIGVAPDAEIVAIKVCTEFDTFCFDEAILPGIIHAASVGSDIINMSLGGLFDRNPSEFCKFLREEYGNLPCGREFTSQTRALINIYRRAIRFANDMGTSIIVSAGNSALDADHTGSLAFFLADFPNVIGVSSTAPVGSGLPAIFGNAPAEPLAPPESLAYYSNYGRSIIDFAAPGGSVELLFLVDDPFNTWCAKSFFVVQCFYLDTVLSNGPGDSFFWAQGTSMAAPHASGVAALMIGANGGDMSPGSLKTAMKKAALDLGQPGKDPIYGYGMASGAALAK